MTASEVTYATFPTYTGDSESTTGKGSNEMGNTEFMELLMAELQNQNPLEPVSDEQFMSQITQMNSFNELKSMNEKMSVLEDISAGIDLLGQGGDTAFLLDALKDLFGAMNDPYSLLASSNIVGKQVELVNDDGDTITGVVSSVYIQDSQIRVTVDGEDYDLTSVVRIDEAEAANG